MLGLHASAFVLASGSPIRHDLQELPSQVELALDRLVSISDGGHVDAGAVKFGLLSRAGEDDQTAFSLTLTQ